MPLGFRQAGLAFAGDPDRKKCTAFGALQQRCECEDGRIRGRNCHAAFAESNHQIVTSWKGGRAV
jgi:hypothetical protein